MKKTLIGLALIGFLIPQITFAAWWNPLTWFKKQPKVEAKIEMVATSTISIATSTPVTEKIVTKQKKIVENKKLPKDLTSLFSSFVSSLDSSIRNEEQFNTQVENDLENDGELITYSVQLCKNNIIELKNVVLTLQNKWNATKDPNIENELLKLYDENYPQVADDCKQVKHQALLDTISLMQNNRNSQYQSIIQQQTIELNNALLQEKQANYQAALDYQAALKNYNDCVAKITGRGNLQPMVEREIRAKCVYPY